MNLLTEKILILYEIAMSISEGPDLASMAKRTLLTIIRKLNCSSGAILRFHKASTRSSFRELVVVPININKNSAYSTALARISTIVPDSLTKDLPTGISLHGFCETNSYYHIMSLPSFGLIVLLKNGQDIKPDDLKDLQPLNQKLAEACNGYLAKQQMIENEMKLKEYGELLESRVADLKNLQVQLVQSGKLASIGELAAGVAHELNQPLMIIRTTAQLMLRKQSKNVLETDYLLEKLNAIEKNTKRMMNIINHLRTFSRQSNSGFRPVSVNKIIQDSFLMIGEQLSLKNIKVIQDFSGDLPKVRGDTNQLEQVFLNLFANAKDAIESKFETQEGREQLQKKIVITTHVSGDENGTVDILVKDTGGGIPKDALKSIFDPFYTTKEVGKGTGLGLSISYGIIQDHKGGIDVIETGPEGTTFRVRCPVA